MIKWAGYGDDDNSWEPEGNISKNALIAFEMQQKKEQKQPPKTQKKKKKATKKKKQLVRAREMPAIGDFCFAKVRGWKPWPGNVIKIEHSTIWVKFYGWNPEEKYVINSGHISQSTYISFLNLQRKMHIEYRVRFG